ncbi:2' O-ribose methyltransferase [Tieghemiomyces parasiticus]|uniref:rRNA methyltransferase 2, mitochondrial n=1 Tax=Tieghemiomyces parasiticus TaxID=78921 RepID=A0A9W8AFR4_9FUNG|nr:2' O-ribose methyltransferase [Tieghemiomyces parasiticus]
MRTLIASLSWLARPQPQASPNSLAVAIRTYASYSDRNRWLHRQKSDPYVKKASDQNYRARSAFKLIELDDKYHLITPSALCVDCGAAPGGWSEVLAQRVYQGAFRRPARIGSPETVKAGEGQALSPTASPTAESDGLVYALDLLPMQPIPGVHCLQGDFTLPATVEALRRCLGGRPADLVVSDMAPSFSGTHSIDHIRIMNLCEDAAGFARGILRPGGSFVCKFLVGGTEKDFSKELKTVFNKVIVAKPKSSRKESAEAFFVCLDKK